MLYRACVYAVLLTKCQPIDGIGKNTPVCRYCCPHCSVPVKPLSHISDIEDLPPAVQEKLFDEVLDRDVQKGTEGFCVLSTLYVMLLSMNLNTAEASVKLCLEKKTA